LIDYQLCLDFRSGGGDADHRRAWPGDFFFGKMEKFLFLILKNPALGRKRFRCTRPGAVPQRGGRGA
jgi:hypothetical protein